MVESKIMETFFVYQWSVGKKFSYLKYNFDKLLMISIFQS